MERKKHNNVFENNEPIYRDLNTIFFRNYNFENNGNISGEELGVLVSEIEEEFNLIVKGDPKYIKITEIYPKDMDYKYAKVNGFIYTLYYDINIIRNPCAFWFSLGDLLYIKLNNGKEIYFVPFSYPVIDIRSSEETTIHFDNPDVFFSSFTDWYEDLFRIYDFVGVDITNKNEIVTSTEEEICSSIDFIATKVQKPNEYYLIKDEFLYTIRDLFQNGVSGEDIISSVNKAKAETGTKTVQLPSLHYQCITFNELIKRNLV